MTSDKVAREELIALLDGGNAHMGFDDVIADFPMEHINSKPLNNPYSFWHFLEHIRIAQWDILEFIRNPQHVSPKYPRGVSSTSRREHRSEGMGKERCRDSVRFGGPEGNRPRSENRSVRGDPACAGLHFLSGNYARCRS